MISTLYLFRHGDATPAGILAGRTNYPLSQQGRSQGNFWHTHLAHVPFTAAWSSPLLRCIETASLILNGNAEDSQHIQIVPDLQEISLGAWEGKEKTWIKQNYPYEWEQRGRDFATIPPPEGENFLELQQRILPAFAHICQKAKHHTASFIVAHQAVNRIIIASLANIPLTNIFSIYQPTAAFTRIYFKKYSQ